MDKLKTDKGKTYNADKGDSFLVYDKDTNEIIRGVLWANEKSGLYGQYYIHQPTLSAINRAKRKVRTAIKFKKGNIKIEVYDSKKGIPKRWNFLSKLIKENFWTVGAEIGLAKGSTTFILGKNFKDLTLYAVDFWPERFSHLGKRFKQRLKSFDGPGNIILIQKPSLEACKDIENESLDFVFIDADHSEESCFADIQVWYPKIKKTGMLLGHDINWDTVKAACDKALGKYDIWSLDNVWYVWKNDLEKLKEMDEPG